MILEQQVALKNNEAVLLLASGATGRAFKAFKSALAVLNKLATSNDLHASEENKPKARKVREIAPITISSINEAGYFVYSRAFLLNLDETTFDIHLYSAAIMFNMALTLHIKDKGTCDKEKSSALRLYNATLSILQESSGAPDCTTIFIATLNNQAQIYYDLCRFEEAREVFPMLLETLYSPEDRSTFDQKEIEEFLQNEILLSASAAAPAA